MNIVVAIVSWLVGIFGWAQIIGSLQNAKSRGPLMTLITIIIWICVLGGIAYFGIVKLGCKVALIIGYAVSLVMIVGKGRIE